MFGYMGRRQKIDNAIDSAVFLAIGAFRYVEGGARSRLFWGTAAFLESFGRGVWNVMYILGLSFVLVDMINSPNGAEVLAGT